MERSQKEYGKLSLDELKGLLDPLINPQRDGLDLTKKHPALPVARLDKVFGPPYVWAPFYELPFLTHLAVTLCSGGLGKKLKQWAKRRNPQRAVLDWMNQSASESLDPRLNVQNPKLFYLATCSLGKSLQALMVYNRSLSGLTEDVRNGDDSAFFKAVRVDRSALACPTFAERLTRAEIQHESGFFKKLRHALTGKLEKQDARFHYLRFTLALLEELGQLDRLNMEDRYTLLAEGLRLYPRTGKDPVRSLDQFIARWRKAHRHEIAISCRRQ